MKKETLLILLLLSAICMLVNALAGWLLLNLGGLASAILSLIFVLNAKKVFGPVANSAYNSCLWSLIVNGAIFLLGNTIGIVLAVVTLGISVIFSGIFVFLIDVGFGIWQLVAWNKLKGDTASPQVAA